jgi:hypothetical protein
MSLVVLICGQNLVQLHEMERTELAQATEEIARLVWMIAWKISL